MKFIKDVDDVVLEADEDIHKRWNVECSKGECGERDSDASTRKTGRGDKTGNVEDGIRL